MEPLQAGALLALLLGGALFYLFFHRDPERVPPDEEGVIISPADGWVKDVKPIKAGEVPIVDKYGQNIPLIDVPEMGVLREGRGGHLVSVYMSLMDVHVNRSPVEGRVENVQYRPGRLMLLMGRTFEIENERNTMVLEAENGLRLGLVQIASPFVRKIHCYVSDGEPVKLGQRIGMIRLGSQVDLILPDEEGLEIVARRGMRVKAGSTVLARMRR